METGDPKRITSLKSLKEKDLRDLLQINTKENIKFLELNLQKQPWTLTNLLTKEEINCDADLSPLQTIDKEMRQQTTVVIIQYVFLPEHVQQTQNMLLSWAQDNELHAKKSCALVFCSDTNLFADSTRSFGYTITIEPASEKERRKILQFVADEIKKGITQQNSILPPNKQQKIPKLEITEDVIEASAGLDLHGTESAAIESYFLHEKFVVEVFTEYKIKILKNYGINFFLPTRGFESIGGETSIKEWTQKRVIKLINDPEKAKYYGLSIPKGLLLYGIPGTGKTFFAKALGKEIGLPLVLFSPDDVLRGIVGETESRLRQIRKLIESLAPVILFIDEFDQIAPGRGSQMSTDSGVSRRMENMLLDWFGDENRKVLIIAATNLIEQIDVAFKRSGRLGDKIVVMLPPDKEARKDIFRVQTQVLRKIPTKDLDMEEVADKTQLWTPAELQRLATDMASYAMDAEDKFVTMKHFKQAYAGIQLNKNERLRSIENVLTFARKEENVDLPFLEKSMHDLMSSGSAEENKEYSRIAGIVKMPINAE